jgi:hypothetical protein
MRPKERRDSVQNDLFWARLDQIVDMKHPLLRQLRAPDLDLYRHADGVMHLRPAMPDSRRAPESPACDSGYVPLAHSRLSSRR